MKSVLDGDTTVPSVPDRAEDEPAHPTCAHDQGCTAEVAAYGPDGRTWCRAHVPWKDTA